MAVLKLETIVSMCEDWQITQPPLLRWKAKLKRVIREGKAILRRGNRNPQSTQRIRTQKQLLTRRMVRVAKRFMPFSRENGIQDDDLTEATVRRFERLADGAENFFKFVSCSRPKMLTFLPSLIVPALTAGKAVELSMRMGGGTAVILLQPWWLRGSEGGLSRERKACLWMSYEHDTAWEKNLKMISVFRVSESADVMRMAASCAELLPSQFSAARVGMTELIAEMAIHGRNSPAPSPMYMSFVRAIQESHRYGFEPAIGHGHGMLADSGLQLPDGVLMMCAHCYILPKKEKAYSIGRSDLPLELVWHSSPHYLPKKLSEEHERVEPEQMRAGLLLPTTVVEDGSYHLQDEEAGGHLERGRQWWSPHSSTRMSLVPVSSPPKSVVQWCKEKVLNCRGSMFLPSNRELHDK